MNDDLLEASKRGDLPEVNRLLAKGAEVNAKNKKGITALKAATQNGHKEVRKLLIKAGAK